MSRSDLLYLKEQDFATYPAIYVLIGGNKRYVGQVAGQKIEQRLTQHFQNKANDWVEICAVFWTGGLVKCQKLIQIISSVG